MRSEARRPARDDPEPERDAAAEALALLAEDARRRPEKERLLAALAAAVAQSPQDCPVIDRLTSELVVAEIREAESTSRKDALTAALREHGWAVRHAHAAGVELGREQAAAAMVPRQRRPRHAAGQGELFAVKGTAAAALGAAFTGTRTALRSSHAWAWLTSAHHAVAIAATAGAGLAAGTALVVAAGMTGPSAYPSGHDQAQAPNPAASVEAAVPMAPQVPEAALVHPRAKLDAASLAPVPSPSSASSASYQPVEQPAPSSPSGPSVPAAPPVTVPVARGQLAVSAPSLDLGAPQAGQLAVTGQFTITNAGGSYARWRVSASSSPDAVTLTDADGNPVTHGWLAPGQSVTVTVSVALAAADPGGSVTVTVRGPGGGTVAVQWEAMLTAVVPSPLPSASLPDPLPS